MRFGSLEDKARWLDAAASLDSHQDLVVRCARDLLDRLVRPGAETVARAVHAFVRDSIRYVPDTRKMPFWRPHPEGEEFADSESILTRGFDDCDGKARLFTSIVRAIGALSPGLVLLARIRPVFHRVPREFYHVQAECRWPGSERVSPSGWVLAELIVKGVSLGADPDSGPKGPTGKRVIE